MNEFKHIRKAINQGIIRTVAKQTKYTAATVSRTFAGRFDVPNKEIVAALWRFLSEHGLDERSTAA